MKQSVVLIEIEGGMVQTYSTQDVVVAIHDRDTEGNPLGEKDRKANEKSFKALRGKLSASNDTDANGALEALNSPAPIDWEKESDRMNHLREKAIAYLKSCFKEDLPGFEIDFEPVTECEWCMIDMCNEDGVLTVYGKNEYNVAENIDLPSLVAICDAVQKAIK